MNEDEEIPDQIDTRDSWFFHTKNQKGQNCSFIQKGATPQEALKEALRRLEKQYPKEGWIPISMNKV